MAALGLHRGGEAAGGLTAKVSVVAWTFAQVTQKKAAAIQQLPDLLDLIDGPEAASSIMPGAAGEQSSRGAAPMPGFACLASPMAWHATSCHAHVPYR